MFKRNNKYHLYLSADEKKLIVKALFDERNHLITAGRYTDGVDDLILKLNDVKQKRAFKSCFDDSKKFFEFALQSGSKMTP